MTCDIYTFSLRKSFFMSTDFSALIAKEYPGRLIIIGRALSGNDGVIVYAITGRSPSSRSRKIEVSRDGAWVKPTDKEILKKGNEELLIYPAILFGQGLAVSNGKQTTDIKDHLSRRAKPTDVLFSALQDWTYEPDAPTFTPRISGCVFPDGKAALSIIKRAEDGSPSKHYFKVPMRPGEGKMVSTYSGENRDPLPSFCGDPEDVLLNDETAAKTSEAVYSALAPKERGRDLRVSVACIFFTLGTTSDFKISVINRSENI
jgi:IMP cyclohydrolase